MYVYIITCIINLQMRERLKILLCQILVKFECEDNELYLNNKLIDGESWHKTITHSVQIDILTFNSYSSIPSSLTACMSHSVSLSLSLSLPHYNCSLSPSLYPYYLMDCGYCLELKLSQKSKQNISTILPFLKAPPTQIYCPYVLVVCTSRINPLIISHHLFPSPSLSPKSLLVAVLKEG